MSFFAGNWYPWPAFLVLALSLSAVKPSGAADLGGDWVSRFPVPTHADLYDVAAQGTTNVVAVGSRGTILTSSDLVSWAAISTGVKDDLLNVIWAGGKYYAVGNKGHVLSSLNGSNWTVSNADSVATDVLQCVAWTGSQLVVAGSYSTGTGQACVVLSSPDGVTWERRTFPALKPIKRLVWASSLLVGLMDGATASSIDGSAWAVHNLPASSVNGGTGTLSLVWTDSQLLVSGDSLWASTNGLVWSEYSTTIVGATNGTPTTLTGVAGLNLSWTGSELVVASRTTAISYISKDQVNFTNFSASLPSPELAAARFGTSVVMVGLAGHVDTQITTGTTAGTWTARNNVAAPLTCLGLAQSSTRFVGVGRGVSWTSPDGNIWTQNLLPSNSFQSVAWSGTQFVAAGSGVWTSPDGVTWTAVSSVPADSNQVWYTVNWLNGRGYASGYDSGTRQVISRISTDNGGTWTTGGMSAVALGIASDGASPNPRLLAVGAGGDVMFSTDGTTWFKIHVELPDGEDFYDVAYGNGRFAAVTTGGSIWTSSTGADGTWQQTLAGSVPLLGITRTGNEFIAVGSAGNLQRSFDGVYWRQGDSSISETLYRVLWTGSRLIAGGASASFVTSDGTPPTAPTLQFTTTTSSMTEGGSVGLIINLSQAWASQITVPLSYSGTAASSRYIPPASPVVFEPGATSKYIVIASNDDHVSISTQTIIVTLGTPTGGAVLGTATTHTIALLDNDPVFDVVPVDQLVLLGSPVTFSAHTAGTVTYQWMKNGAAIGGASAATYTIAAASVASAGSYGVAATAASGIATTASAVGRLGVVTPQTSAPVVNSGGMITFAAMVAAPAGSLSYQWAFDAGSGAVALTDGGRISGSTTSKLTLTGLVPGDTGTYTCVVTLGTGISPPTLTAATVHAVINALPIITPPAAIATRVASSVDFTPTATASPSTWTVTGLPAGLAYSRLTGRITGVPVKGGVTSSVTLVATNLHGSGPPVTMSITVAPLPAITVGSFIVLLPRDGPSNGNLGGRLDLTTTATGGFSGKLTMPATPVPFSGALGGVSSGNPGGSVTIPRAAPYGTVQLAFTIDKTTGVVATTVSSMGSTYTPAGYARAGATSAGMGAYNFALSPDVSSPAGTPTGAGYGQFTVPATGLLAVSGRLADGSAYLVSTYTATDGSIPLYSSLYSGGKGSLLGSLVLNGDAASSFANNFITGPLTWYKGADAGNRSYAGGIALMTLDVDGGRYSPPVGAPTDTGIMMNLTAGTGNAKPAFSGAGLPASRNPNGNFTVAALAKVTPPVPNVALTTLAFTTGTGLFNGQFTLVDTDTTVVPNKPLTRVVQYFGVLIRPGGLPAMVGKGFFNLPQMPTASPPFTSANSPIESGEVTLSR